MKLSEDGIRKDSWEVGCRFIPYFKTITGLVPGKTSLQRKVWWHGVLRYDDPTMNDEYAQYEENNETVWSRA